MELKIVCFEDDPEDREHLRAAFECHTTSFLFYTDAETDWQITDAIAKEIARFNPDFAIVDLRYDRVEDGAAGLRTIRGLGTNTLTAKIQIIAWSVLLGNGPDGEQLRNTVERVGVKTMLKSKLVAPSAHSFLRAAGIQP